MQDPPLTSVQVDSTSFGPIKGSSETAFLNPGIPIIYLSFKIYHVWNISDRATILIIFKFKVGFCILLY